MSGIDRSCESEVLIGIRTGKVRERNSSLYIQVDLVVMSGFMCVQL